MELFCCQCKRAYKIDVRQPKRRICPQCYQAFTDNSIIQDDWIENLQEGVFLSENLMSKILMSQIGRRI